MAITAGSSWLLSVSSDTQTARAMPSMTMSLMNSTYARHVGAPLETLSTLFDSSSSRWIVLPSAVISAYRAASADLCSSSNSSGL